MENLKIGALVAVNCLGDVIDPLTNRKIAGLRGEDGKTLADTEEIMIGAGGGSSEPLQRQHHYRRRCHQCEPDKSPDPAHSMYDGDTIFALSAGDVKADLSVPGLPAARVMERAVVSALLHAEGLCGLPCASDIEPRQKSFSRY